MAAEADERACRSSSPSPSSPSSRSDPNNVKIVKEWQPIAKTFASQGTTLNANLAVLDGGQALNQFTQTILTGKTDAKSALQTFESGLKSVLKK